MFGIYHRMRFFDLKVRLLRHTLTSVKEVWLTQSVVYFARPKVFFAGKFCSINKKHYLFA